MEATWPEMPTGQVAKAQTNFVQLRGGTQIGRTWTETYGPLFGPSGSATHVADAAWLSQVNTIYQRRMVITKSHPSQRNVLGTGAGTPIINGPGQTGSSITTTGWAHGQTVLKAGDIVLLPGGRVVYDITADVVSDSSGNATLTINPPIFVGASPTDNGAIVTNLTQDSVTYRCIVKSLQPPKAEAPEWYQGATVVFMELPTQSYLITFGGGTGVIEQTPTGAFIGGSLAGGTPAPQPQGTDLVPEPPPLTIFQPPGLDTNPNSNLSGPLSLATGVGSDPPHVTVVGHGASISPRLATGFQHTVATAVVLALSPGDQPRPISQIPAILARYNLAWQVAWGAQEEPGSIPQTYGQQPPRHALFNNQPISNAAPTWGPQHTGPFPR